MKKVYSISAFAQSCGVSNGTMRTWLHEVCDDALLRRGVNTHGRKAYTAREAGIIASYLGFELN